MIVGYIIAVLFLLVIFKFVTKRTKNKKLDHAAGKVHKILGVSLLPVTVLHLVMTWGLRKQRPVMMYILGFIMIAFVCMAIVSYLCRKSLKKRWIVIHRIAACTIALCLIGHIAYGFSSLFDYQHKVSKLVITETNAKGVPDGSYIGECNVGYVYAKVEVKVVNEQMTEINLIEHRTEKGHPAEVILKDMIENQQIKVDAVSGATNSSKVIMKAVENALELHNENQGDK